MLSKYDHELECAEQKKADKRAGKLNVSYSVCEIKISCSPSLDLRELQKAADEASRGLAARTKAMQTFREKRSHADVSILQTTSSPNHSRSVPSTPTRSQTSRTIHSSPIRGPQSPNHSSSEIATARAAAFGMIIQHAKSSSQNTTAQSQRKLVAISESQLDLKRDYLDFEKQKHEDYIELERQKQHDTFMQKERELDLLERQIKIQAIAAGVDLDQDSDSSPDES